MKSNGHAKCQSKIAAHRTWHKTKCVNEKENKVENSAIQNTYFDLNVFLVTLGISTILFKIEQEIMHFKPWFKI